MGEIIWRSFRLDVGNRLEIGIEIACIGRDDMLCYENYGGSTRGKHCGAAPAPARFYQANPLCSGFWI
jgi:hypothetical protein